MPTPSGTAHRARVCFLSKVCEKSGLLQSDSPDQYSNASDPGTITMRKTFRGERIMAGYANRITCIETDDKGDEQQGEIPFMTGYTVFNADQYDVLPRSSSLR